MKSRPMLRCHTVRSVPDWMGHGDEDELKKVDRSGNPLFAAGHWSHVAAPDSFQVELMFQPKFVKVLVSFICAVVLPVVTVAAKSE